jgi:uncharacterized membrane protein YkoI
MKAPCWSCALPYLAALCVGAGLALHAQADDRRDHDRDHDRARAALKAGEVLPLQEVLDKVQRSHPGEVLEVELEREAGRWVYELKLLQGGGRLLRLDVDAKTATVLRSRPRLAPEGKAASATSGELRP